MAEPMQIDEDGDEPVLAKPKEEDRASESSGDGDMPKRPEGLHRERVSVILSNPSVAEADEAATASQEAKKIKKQSSKRQRPTPAARQWQNTALDVDLGINAFYQSLGLRTIWGAIRDETKKERIMANSNSAEDTTNGSDASNLIVTLKSGWASKKAPVVKGWSRRWFVLKRRRGYSTLAFYKSDKDKNPIRVIVMGPTTRILTPRPEKSDNEYEIVIITSTDGVEKEFRMAADSSLEQRSWAAMIQVAVEGAIHDSIEENYLNLYDEAGIKAFILRYGVRKLKSRGNVQTRVLELNFINKEITVAKRGQIIESLPFSYLKSAVGNETHREGHTLDLRMRNTLKPWTLYLDSGPSRNDLLELLEEIMDGTYTTKSLRHRLSQLQLKEGYMERKNLPGEEQMVTPNATLKGRFWAVLTERSISFFPAEDPEDNGMERPWYVVGLGGLEISHDAPKRVLTIGKVSFVCDTPEDCLLWFDALQEAATVPAEVIDTELKHRHKLRVMYERLIRRIKKLLCTRVSPSGLPRESGQDKVTVMLKRLWKVSFPKSEWEGPTSARWQDIGFQRGGPVSDLRASGLLGLHCLIYFAEHYRTKFIQMVEGQMDKITDSQALGYPVCVAGINVVALLVEMLGIGDAGIHTEGCSKVVTHSFAALVCSEAKRQLAEPPYQQNGERLMKRLSSEKVNDTGIYVFEELFCIFMPLLDSLFVEMGAGYMEFGQVLLALRKQIDAIMQRHPADLETVKIMANEPATDLLQPPFAVSENAEVHVHS